MSPDICKHYGNAGGMALVCAMGHDIRALAGGAELGWMRRTPCTKHITGSLGHQPGGQDCADLALPSAEDMRANEAEWARVADAMFAGRCPECGGDLRVEKTARTVVAECPRCPGVGYRGKRNCR